MRIATCCVVICCNGLVLGISGCALSTSTCQSCDRRGGQTIMTTKVMLPVASYRLPMMLSGKTTTSVSSLKPKQCIDCVLLYETKPTAGVVGTAKVRIQSFGSPRQIWEYYGKALGESREEYESHWGGRSSVGVFELTDVQTFVQPRPVSEFGLSRPPHGMTYIPSHFDWHHDSLLPLVSSQSRG